MKPHRKKRTHGNRNKATKNVIKRWKKGHSCSSNPQHNEHRQKVGMGYTTSGKSTLTAAALAKLDASNGQMAVDGSEFDATSVGGNTFKTFATNFTECTNVSFNQIHRLWTSNSAIHKEVRSSVFSSMYINIQGNNGGGGGGGGGAAAAGGNNNNNNVGGGGGGGTGQQGNGDDMSDSDESTWYGDGGDDDDDDDDEEDDDYEEDDEEETDEEDNDDDDDDDDILEDEDNDNSSAEDSDIFLASSTESYSDDVISDDSLSDDVYFNSYTANDGFDQMSFQNNGNGLNPTLSNTNNGVHNPPENFTSGFNLSNESIPTSDFICYSAQPLFYHNCKIQNSDSVLSVRQSQIANPGFCSRDHYQIPAYFHRPTASSALPSKFEHRPSIHDWMCSTHPQAKPMKFTQKASQPSDFHVSTHTYAEPYACLGRGSLFFLSLSLLLEFSKLPNSYSDFYHPYSPPSLFLNI